MSAKTYSFRDEDGNLVNYTVKEMISIDKKEYILMAPETDRASVEVYKFSTVNGNECLEIVDSEQELSKIKSVSKII